MATGIEKLAVEIEEIANGVYPSEIPQHLLISKAKRIQQLARSRRTAQGTGVSKVRRANDLRLRYGKLSFVSLPQLRA